MTRTQIVKWFISHKENILRDIFIKSRYCIPNVIPVGEDYVYKNTLGIKFFIVKKSLVLHCKINNISKLVKMPDLYEYKTTMKKDVIFEEIYFVDYNSDNDILTYVYAKDVNSGRYDTHSGLAIDLTKIPKTTISGNIWSSLHNDNNNNQILTLEELFIYKDIIQP